MIKHAKYSPSKLPRIVRCPSSVKAEKPFTQKESVYAKEGTALHELTELHLKAREYNVSEYIVTQVDYSFDKEHLSAVQEVLDWVASLRLQYADTMAIDKGEFIEVEVSLELFADIYSCPGLKEVYGTLDYMFYAEDTLYVVDWKYGKGIEVFPDSEQLIVYAAGALAYKNKIHANIKTVSLVIGQPRLYNGERFKVYETTPAEIWSWISGTLVKQLNLIEDNIELYKPSDKACMWCLAKNTCEARQQHILKMAAKVFEIHAITPAKADTLDLSEFLASLPDLKKAIKDIEQYAKQTIMKGKKIPGWKLVPGRSIRQWVDEDKAKEYYLNREDLDPDDLAIVKFKSPTQIESLIGKNNLTDEDLALVHKPEGKPTLVKETDKRDAIEYQSVEEKFKSFVK